MTLVVFCWSGAGALPPLLLARKKRIGEPCARALKQTRRFIISWRVCLVASYLASHGGQGHQLLFLDKAVRLLAMIHEHFPTTTVLLVVRCACQDLHLFKAIERVQLASAVSHNRQQFRQGPRGCWKSCQGNIDMRQMRRQMNC